MTRLEFTKVTRVPEEASTRIEEDRTFGLGEKLDGVRREYAREFVEEDRAFINPELTSPTGGRMADMRCKIFDEERYVCAVDGGVGLYKRSKISDYEGGMGGPPSVIIDDGKGYEQHYLGLLEMRGAEDEIKKYRRLKDELRSVAESMGGEEELAPGLEELAVESVPNKVLMGRIEELEKRIEKLEE